jgi:pyruvate formate lyase activating enzyme
MSTEDGPGIRTTVFFKGCNLNCLWCHNPESISFAPQNAIEVIGTHYPPEKLAKILLKDKAYFGNGGGVTLGGGEPLLNIAYLKELLPLLKAEGINIAVDTAGLFNYSAFEEIADMVDLVLFDLKIMDNAAHIKFTEADNAVILANAQKLGSKTAPKVWVRTPIIPNATDSLENIGAIAAFIKQNMPCIERWELVPFNNLCKNKYNLLGKEWHYDGIAPASRQKADELLREAQKYTDKARFK